MLCLAKFSVVYFGAVQPGGGGGGGGGEGGGGVV